MNKDLAEIFDKRFASSNAEEIVSFFALEYENKLAFSSSMGAEDQVLTHMIWTKYPGTRIFTLDTGRLFKETYELMEKVSQRYKRSIEIYFPSREDVEKMVSEKGINLFYKSIENRKKCCHVRKTMPLLRALSGVEVWITGIRRDQALSRYSAPVVEWSDQYKLLKINPLRDWTQEMVWDYIKKNNVPYNDLHDQGFPSIGCEPCTRAILAGEDIRAGRWWWETPDSKECGIHNSGK
jgi:phosphoadenosine phosphosulfate reductase